MVRRCLPVDERTAVCGIARVDDSEGAHGTYCNRISPEARRQRLSVMTAKTVPAYVQRRLMTLAQPIPRRAPRSIRKSQVVACSFRGGDDESGQTSSIAAG